MNGVRGGGGVQLSYGPGKCEERFDACRWHHPQTTKLPYLFAYWFPSIAAMSAISAPTQRWPFTWDNEQAYSHQGTGVLAAIMWSMSDVSGPTAMGYSAKCQYTECQSANFFCVPVCWMPVCWVWMYGACQFANRTFDCTQSLTLLSIDQRLEQLFADARNTHTFIHSNTYTWQHDTVCKLALDKMAVSAN